MSRLDRIAASSCTPVTCLTSSAHARSSKGLIQASMAMVCFATGVSSQATLCIAAGTIRDFLIKYYTRPTPIPTCPSLHRPILKTQCSLWGTTLLNCTLAGKVADCSGCKLMAVATSQRLFTSSTDSLAFGRWLLISTLSGLEHVRLLQACCFAHCGKFLQHLTGGCVARPLGCSVTIPSTQARYTGHGS